MNKIIFIFAIFLIYFSARNYIKTQWIYRTGVQVYNEQDLYNAVDVIQDRPWWKAKNIVIRARNLVLDRNITVYHTTYFTDTFYSMTSKPGIKKKIKFYGDR